MLSVQFGTYRNERDFFGRFRNGLEYKSAHKLVGRFNRISFDNITLSNLNILQSHQTEAYS